MAAMTDEQVRDEVRGWLADAWDPDITLAEWWERLAESGWAVPTWPEEWFGKGLPGASSPGSSSEELRAAGAIGPPAGLGVLLAGPTILAHGTDEQKERYLRPILNGQEAWCQLFSEPGAGSDLASLQCRAERDGDEWIVNGQKVWTSGAQTADLGMLLARTDPDAPKHKGISYFAIEMDQPGVEVRPLREMTGGRCSARCSSRTPRVRRLGDDRRARTAAGPSPTPRSRTSAPASAAAAVEPSAARCRGRRRACSSGGSATSPPARGRDARRARRGPDVNRTCSRSWPRTSVATTTRTSASGSRSCTSSTRSAGSRLRVKAAKASGQRPGPEGNTAKLLMSRITRLSRDLGPEILGPYGMLMGPDTPGGGVAQELALFAPAVSIYGGSDEMQKNIIGERVLGLPKEPGADPRRRLPRAQGRDATRRELTARRE